MSDTNPFIEADETKEVSTFNYLESTQDQLKKHLNTVLTGKAMRTYEHLMLHSKDEKIRKECADKIMEHSGTSAKNNTQATGQSAIQVNLQFNDYISKAASTLIDVATAAKEAKDD